MKSSSYCMYHNLSVRRRPLVAVATITTAKEDVRRSSIIGEKSVRRMLRINCAVKQGTKVNGEFFKLTSVVKKLHLHNATRHQVIGTFVLEVAEEKQRFFSPNRDVLLNLTKQFRWLTKLYHGGPVHVSCITLQSCLGDGDIVGEADNPPIQLFMRMRMCCHHKIKALHGTLPVHYKLFFPAAPHTSWVHLCIKERQKYFLKKNLLSCIPSQHVKNMLKKNVCVCAFCIINLCNCTQKHIGIPMDPWGPHPVVWEPLPVSASGASHDRPKLHELLLPGKRPGDAITHSRHNASIRYYRFVIPEHTTCP